MKKMISMGLWMVGGLLLLIALVSSGVSIVSLLERLQYGPGLFFADVEFFGFVALIAAILGMAGLFAAKKLSVPERR